MVATTKSFHDLEKKSVRNSTGAMQDFRAYYKERIVLTCFAISSSCCIKIVKYLNGDTAEKNVMQHNFVSNPSNDTQDLKTWKVIPPPPPITFELIHNHPKSPNMIVRSLCLQVVFIKMT